MSVGVFWAVTLPLVALVFAGALGAGLSVGPAWLAAFGVVLVMLAVDAAMNVRRSWAAYRDSGDWPGES